MTQEERKSILARLAIVAEKVDNIVADNDGVDAKLVYDLTHLETDQPTTVPGYGLWRGDLIVMS